jgi:hypothetical protein
LSNIIAPSFPQLSQVFPNLLKQLGRGIWGSFPQFPSSPVVYRGFNWGDQESMTYTRFGFSPVFPQFTTGVLMYPESKPQLGKFEGMLEGHNKLEAA